MARKFTEQDKQNIRKLQATLLKIDQKIPVFFNITDFQKRGLVKGKGEYTTHMGKRTKIKTTWHLTAKGKVFLNVVI